jgi:membrane-bound ClpP family serine protease
MTGIMLLFALGLIFLGFEVFVPGGVLGAIGGVLLLAGCGVAFAEFGTDGGVLALVIAVVLVGLTLYAELFLLPNTRFGKRMFLESAIKARSQPPPAEPSTIIGREGEALTTLAPTGFVLIGGKKYEAASQSGLMPKGAPVKVVGADNFRLIVSKL